MASPSTAKLNTLIQNKISIPCEYVFKTQPSDKLSETWAYA